jgi:hypothetical protein
MLIGTPSRRELRVEDLSLLAEALRVPDQPLPIAMGEELDRCRSDSFVSSDGELAEIASAAPAWA